MITSEVVAVLRDQVAPAVKCFLGEFLGVAAFVFGLNAAKIDFEEDRTERFDLLTCGSAHVIGADHGSEAASGGNGLQASHTGADHEHFRGRNGSRGGH